MRILFLFITFFSLSSQADVIEELETITEREAYFLTVTAERISYRKNVEPIFGPRENICSTAEAVVSYVSGRFGDRCNSKYNESRAKRSIVFASHLLRNQGVKNPRKNDFVSLAAKSVEIYSSDFEFRY